MMFNKVTLSVAPVVAKFIVFESLKRRANTFDNNIQETQLCNSTAFRCFLKLIYIVTYISL